MMRPISEHNSFYLAEDRRQRPKEYFKFLAQHAGPRLSRRLVRVLDVGCATGEFLGYLRSLYPAVSITGIDVAPDFIAKAEENVPGGSFLSADIYSGVGLPAGKYDLVFMSGVNYLYAEFETWLRNLISLTAETAYVFGVFNPDDLDIRATVQRAGDTNSATPWNLISKKSIALFLDGLGVRHNFIDWELPIAVPRLHEDPMRSWTIETKDGHFLAVNGTQVLHRFALLQIDVSG